jgi:AP2-like factor (euAP2 lineage)
MSSSSWCFIKVKSGQKVKIDKRDKKRIEQHSWRVTFGTTGRARVVTSIRTPEGVRSLTLGKFLMKPKKGFQVYPRRFENELDYRRENLIVCTLKERQRLLPKKRTETSSRFKGVSFNKLNKKWRASIEVDGKALNLGDFLRETQAASAYNKAAREYFGRRAYQNPVNNSKIQRSR